VIRLHLRTRYALALLFLLLATVSSLSAALLTEFSVTANDLRETSAKTLDEALLHQYETRAEDLSLTLAESFVDEVYLLQIDALATVVDGLAEREDINGIAVFDNEGLLYQKGQQPGLSPDALETHFVSHKFFETTSNIVEFRGTSVASSAPIRLGDEVIGHVLVDLSLTPIEQQIASVRESQDKRIGDGLGLALWVSLGITLIFGGLGVILAVFVGDRLSRPIDMLSQLARKIGQGNYDFPTNIGGPAEIRELARSLHSMARDLRDTTVSKDHLDNILFGMLDGLLVVGPDGIVTTANSAAGRLLGWPTGELVGRPVNSFFHAMQSAGHQESSSMPRESTARTRNGEALPVLLSVSALRGPSETGASNVWVFRDITSIKTAQDALVSAVTESERANRAKSQFLANMSHELRTPLNAIIGYSEMLAEEAREKGQNETSDDLDRIHAAGRHLLGLIDDVLDLSKIEAGKMELKNQEFQLRPLIEGVAESVRHLLDEHGNKFALNLSADLQPIVSDETKVRQIIYNILSNAAKFTRNGAVTVTAREMHDDGPGKIAIEVADTGIGMSPDQLDRIFGEFIQADNSTTREYGGTGLGLAISLQLARMLGGDIHADSTPGSGSVFTILLPIQMPGEIADGAMVESRALEAHRRANFRSGQLLLVINSDRGQLNRLARQLGDWGFGVVSALQGEEGVRLARALNPVAVLLDPDCRDAARQPVATRLAKDRATADIPLILTHGLSDNPPEQEHLVSQLTALLPKAGGQSALVVEDDLSARRMVAESLQKEGWQVSEAENGQAALETIRSSKPDLIVLDVVTPGIEGNNLLGEIKSCPDTAAVPVMVLTAKTMTVGERMKLHGQAETIIEKDAGPWIETVRIMSNIIGRRADADHLAGRE
jgi:PAS domain S-box-containing protein